MRRSQCRVDTEKQAFLDEIKFKIETGDWHTQKRAKRRSGIWDTIYEVFDGDRKVENAYFCIHCRIPIYNNYKAGNTTGLLRHICFQTEVNGAKKILIAPKAKIELREAAANFVAKDLRPYSAIEGDGLRKLCLAVMKFGQKYKIATENDLMDVLPCRNTVKAYVSKNAESIKEVIRGKLDQAKEIGGFAITSDAWTDNHKRLTYICIIAHCNIVTEEHGIERQKYVLYVNEITEAIKSKEVIVKYLLDVLKDYGFNEEEVREFVTFVTDRGSNFKYGLTSKKFKRFNCYTHLIHNLVKSMFRDSRVNTIKKTASKIVSFVKKTSMNSQLKTTLKKFSSTRWNGAFDMFSSLFENYDQLRDLLYTRQRANPRQPYFDLISTIDPEDIGRICRFLKQFKGLTKSIEGDAEETLSYVWPTYMSLKFMLEPSCEEEDENVCAIIEEMKAKGRSYMLSKHSDFKPTLDHKMAMVLNPLFKSMRNVSESEKREVFDKIESMLERPVRIQTNEQRNTQTIARATARLHPYFLTFFDVEEEQSNDPEPQPSELELYLKHSITSINIDVTEWWNEVRKIYPQLFRIFARISSIPASSASAERLFSLTGLIVTNLRSTILPKNVNDLILATNKLQLQEKNNN